MIRFIVGCGAVWAGLFAWAAFDRVEGAAAIEVGLTLIAAKMLGVPLVAAWFTAELLDRWRPRRVFDARVRRPLAPLIAGFGAGVLGALLTAGLFALAESALVDVSAVEPGDLDIAAMSGAAIFATGTVALGLGRLRVGDCVHCGYDLAGCVGGRCPECGAVGAAFERGAALSKG